MTHQALQKLLKIKIRYHELNLENSTSSLESYEPELLCSVRDQQVSVTG